MSWNLTGHRGFGQSQGREHSNRRDGLSEKAGHESTNGSGRLSGGLAAAITQWRVNCELVWSLNLIVWGWELASERSVGAQEDPLIGVGREIHFIRSLKLFPDT